VKHISAVFVLLSSSIITVYGFLLLASSNFFYISIHVVDIMRIAIFW